MDYNQITENIFIGTNQCCAVGISEVLQQEGITTDISLEDVRIDHPYGVEMYMWLPTKDGTPLSPDQLAFGVKTLAEMKRQGRNVYVHCKNGHGRATTLVAAYFISEGKSAKEALAFIKERRPTVHLQEAQMQALEEYASAKNA